MRFGLIGYGSWGRFHARSIAAQDGLSLTVIACRSQASAGRRRAITIAWPARVGKSTATGYPNGMPTRRASVPTCFISCRTLSSELAERPMTNLQHRASNGTGLAGRFEDFREMEIGSWGVDVRNVLVDASGQAAPGRWCGLRDRSASPADEPDKFDLRITCTTP